MIERDMRTALLAQILALGLILSLATPAAAQDDMARPSFDCAAATQPVETLICADAELAVLDVELAQAYRARLAASADDAQAVLRLEQRAWNRDRGAVCGVDAGPAIQVDDAIGCLIALYRARLQALAPAAASLVQAPPRPSTTGTHTYHPHHQPNSARSADPATASPVATNNATLT